MNVIFTKRIFVTLLLALFSASFSFASDNETREKPIILKPIKDTTGPFKPKSPSLLSISAYTDGDAVVVTSNVDIIDHVLIYYSESGQSYYCSTVALDPQCRCQIAHTETMLTLQITVDDTIYEGSFLLY